MTEIWLSTILNYIATVAVRLGLATQKCAETVILDLDFTSDLPCLKLTISKTLGFAIVAGSSLVKMPQIVKILGQSSTSGLSLTGATLELIALTVNAAYSMRNGYAWTTYAESLFLSIQTSLIAACIIYFGDTGKNSGGHGRKSKSGGGGCKSLLAALYIAIYGVSVFALIGNTQLVTVATLKLGQMGSIPLVVIGKLAQVITNWQHGSTGQMSAVTTFLVALGSLVRIFTSSVETGDLVLVVTYLASSTVNVILLLQLLYYWNSSIKSAKQKKKRV